MLVQRAEQARRLLSGVGIARDDSDDELGLEDHPWEWIYSSAKQNPNTIIGAQMGGFECHLGDTVLLKAEGLAKEAWVGLICSFLADEKTDEKAANFMWFSSEREIRNKEKKRKDAYANELYVTPSWDVNTLASINGKAQILSSNQFLAKYPMGKIPTKSKHSGKTFICRRGCNTRTATYTDEFIWEQVYRDAADIDALIARVQKDTKVTRKRKRDDSQDDASYRIQHDTEVSIPHREHQMPQKRRRFEDASTPPSKRGQFQHATPTNKRVSIRKPLEFTPLGTRTLSLSESVSSPFQLARTRLHVSTVPKALPCREQEFATVYSHLEAAIADGSGSCIYISGTPGTGKTATVREVILKLHAAVLADELDDFVFVEINGMKLTDPYQSYSLLWEALHGYRVSPTHALGLLDREFRHPSPRRVPCVVLMDELDQLVTKTQGVLYNYMNWPNLRHSKLIIIAVANTMDLPERTLSNKISSRLGLTRITFPGYTHTQLMMVIESRLHGIPGNLVEPDAIQFASRKVAAVSGDCRRCLDVCRRAVEIAESASMVAQQEQATPTKQAKNDAALERMPGRRLGKVTINTIKQAIAEATSTPTQHYLRSLPLSSKLFLGAMLARIRRSGVPECTLREVLDEAKRLVKTANGKLTETYTDLLCGPPATPMGSKHPRAMPAARVSAMGASAVALVDAGVLSLEARKGERAAKVRLNISDVLVQLAIKGDDELEGSGV